MMEHLFSEGLARDLSEDTLLWIDSMGYSLDWLFFGQGAMLKNGYRPVPLFREGGAAPLDGREIRLRRRIMSGGSRVERRESRHQQNQLFHRNRD